MDDDDGLEGLDQSNARDRGILRAVLAINLAQSALGFGVGTWASSTALIGAALDNLADASVYAVGIYAVGRSVRAKVAAARLSGWLLIGLSVMLLVEVIRRFLGAEEPVGPAMMVMAGVNAGINVFCLRLLRRHRGQDVNFKASSIFTTNDSIVNLAILMAGILVMWFGSNLPDLILGVIVAGIAANGGREILEEASKAAAKGP
ncbi:MAG: cation transporter [Variovorax paradoxus]|jgi:Co/Zn/Cd efflux system component|uniref:cation transporter n=1 Tax=Pseudorhodoferax sp. LjRoot39 TaxID=3342328 RepID=UPI000DB40C36|nr:cation transporter [Burkholderiales bacterium]PZP99200.1 MAG: cation transporter [Variovorax paradoxus]PZQ11001.1 MAG: cation transporter [Variovorax paradoxus]